MSTTAADRPTQTPPTQTLPTAGPAGPASRAAGTARTAGPVRRSIFPKGACPTPTATFPVVTLQAATGVDWRGQAQTEELPAASRHGPSPSRRTVARHLRSALIGTLLAVVAISGLSAYASAGITNARSTALCRAHITCK
nr:MAG TPA: hypothetical protein [Caudoviricetes sp.]